MLLKKWGRQQAFGVTRLGIKRVGQRFKTGLFIPMAGFGLLEIAIALSIVGLLGAGVYKGYGLLERARLQRTVSQIQDIYMAHRMFKERYGSIPGDWSEATLFGDMRAGNGNGVLDGDSLTPWSEVNLFWAHLLRTGFLTGVSFVKSGAIHPSKGVFVPKTPLGVGIFVVSNPSNLTGIWLRLADPVHSQQAFLTPVMAHALDIGLDNGQPLWGRVRAQNSGAGRGCVTEDGAYNLPNKRRCCVLYVSLEKE